MRVRPDLFYKFDMGRGLDPAGYSLWGRSPNSNGPSLPPETHWSASGSSHNPNCRLLPLLACSAIRTPRRRELSRCPRPPRPGIGRADDDV
jgi:hypothetical protein